MIESDLVNLVVSGSLLTLVILTLAAAYRVAVGPEPADRLQAVETITVLLIGIIVLLAVVQGTPQLVDAALALAAFGFIGTLAIARYISEGRVF